MERLWWIAGSLCGFVSVAAGAFGAHALKSRLEADLLAIFDTGARYNLAHALALLAVGALVARVPSAAATTAGWAFLTGTIVFSGSLYALALTGIRGFGAITPFGGVALLVGWIALAVAGSRLRRP